MKCHFGFCAEWVSLHECMLLEIIPVVGGTTSDSSKTGVCMICNLQPKCVRTRSNFAFVTKWDLCFLDLFLTLFYCHILFDSGKLPLGMLPGQLHVIVHLEHCTEWSWHTWPSVRVESEVILLIQEKHCLLRGAEIVYTVTS